MKVTDCLYDIKKNGEVIRHVHPPLEYTSMKESVGYFTGKVSHKGEDLAVKEAWQVYVGDKNLTVCIRGTELLVLKNARFAGYKAALITLTPDATRLVERFTLGDVTFKAKRQRIKNGWIHTVTFKLQDDVYEVVIRQETKYY